MAEEFIVESAQPTPFAGPQPDALEMIRANMVQEYREGRMNPDDAARWREILEDANEDAAARIEDLRVEVKENLVEFVNAEADARDGLLEAHPEILDRDASQIQAADIMPVMEGIAEHDFAQVETAHEFNADMNQKMLDTWNEIIDMREASGADSPELIAAARAQIETAQEQLDASNDDFEDQIEFLHNDAHARIDYVRETNDASGILGEPIPDIDTDDNDYNQVADAPDTDVADA